MPTTRSPEPILPVALIALDIDGTLIGDDLVIGPDTRRAVAAARRRGIPVAIVTGRMVSSAMRFALELGLDGPIVGYQGGLIRDMPAPGSGRVGRLLRHQPLAASAARDIIAWTSARGLDPHVNHLERFILRADDPYADDYSAFMGAPAELVPDLATSIDHPVTKVLAAGDPPLPEALAAAARERFRGIADVTISHPRFLEFVAPGVSKGRAVRWLARHFRVKLGATLAIGDQWNDLEMIAEVGHGTAMPTAPRPVQAVARYIAPPVAEEGVARMIEALVLARPAAATAAARRMAEAADLVRAGIETGRRSRRRDRGAGRERPSSQRVTARIVADDDAGRAEAVGILRGGGVVALPTDTVYGIAVALDTPGGIERLFEIKRRPPDKGVMLLLDRPGQAAEIGIMTPAATALAGACWPGGLSIVVPQRRDRVLPAVLTGGAATIGLRVPDHPSPRALARGVGPLPTTSANVSGLPEAATAGEIADQLGDAIELILDAGPAHGGPASTVVDCAADQPRILRAGAVGPERVDEILAAAGLPRALR